MFQKISWSKWFKCCFISMVLIYVFDSWNLNMDQRNTIVCIVYYCYLVHFAFFPIDLVLSFCKIHQIVNETFTIIMYLDCKWVQDLIKIKMTEHWIYGEPFLLLWFNCSAFLLTNSNSLKSLFETFWNDSKQINSHWTFIICMRHNII